MRASGPPSLGILTAKYYSRVEIHGQEPRPSLPDAAAATAERLRATWGPFFAEAGTHELSGETSSRASSESRRPRHLQHDQDGWPQHFRA
jgi:hypothetical protein